MQSINVTPKVVNHAALDAALKAAVATCTGFSTSPSAFLLHFLDNATPLDIATATTIYNAHDPAVLTSTQQTEVAGITDTNALLTAADGALAQITTNLAEIAGETMPANLASAWLIMQRQLARETQSLNRQYKIIKALKWLANKVIASS